MATIEAFPACSLTEPPTRALFYLIKMSFTNRGIEPVTVHREVTTTHPERARIIAPPTFIPAANTPQYEEYHSIPYKDGFERILHTMLFGMLT